MYHQKTAGTTKRRSWLIAITCLLVAVIVVLAVTQNASAAAREQAAKSLRNSILASAKECCAIEGAYPKSLTYLEEHYGLVVNRSNYLITYESFSDNVVPSVVVVAK